MQATLITVAVVVVVVFVAAVESCMEIVAERHTIFLYFRMLEYSGSRDFDHIYVGGNLLGYVLGFKSSTLFTLGCLDQ